MPPKHAARSTASSLTLGPAIKRQVVNICAKFLPPSRTFLNQLGYVAAALAIAFGYYFYLNALYLVDEVLEGDKLRELTLVEKTTIYMQTPKDLEHLKRFVLHYSICPSVHEIKIRSRSDKEWKDMVISDGLFKFTKTHSLVSFEPPVAVGETTFPLFELKDIATEGKIERIFVIGVGSRDQVSAQLLFSSLVRCVVVLCCAVRYCAVL